MELNVRSIVSELKEQANDIYESEYFPIYCLGGGVIMVGLTNDFLWLLFGIVGFAYGIFKGRLS